MTRLDAAMMREADARRALLSRLEALAVLVSEAKRAVVLDESAPVRTLHSKALAVQEATLIWEATKTSVQAVMREKPSRHVG